MGLCQGHLEGLGPYTLNVSKSPLIIVTTKKMLPKVFLRELVLSLLKIFDCCRLQEEIRVLFSLQWAPLEGFKWVDYRET